MPRSGGVFRGEVSRDDGAERRNASRESPPVGAAGVGDCAKVRSGTAVWWTFRIGVST